MNFLELLLILIILAIIIVNSQTCVIIGNDKG